MTFIAKNFNELSTTELYEILKARAEIFILERKMCCLDLDGVDYISRHFFIENDGRVIAYLRAFYDGDNTDIVQIGRVLSIEHGVGLGAEIMTKAIEDIKKIMKCKAICLDSQKHAVGFYEKLGFKAVSGEFLEEGVVHIEMELRI